MPTKQRIDPTTVPPAAEPATGAPPQDPGRPWEYEHTPGPWDLYRHFALHFIDQEGYLKGLDDEAYQRAHDAIDIAISIVLRCAKVDQTWTDHYHRIVADFKEVRLP